MKLFSQIKALLLLDKLRLWHMVVGFAITTVLSVAISHFSGQAALVQSQRIAEVSKFSASSQEFDNLSRQYMYAVINQNDDRPRLRDAIIGNMQRQYSDLETAKIYLGPNGNLVAERYQRNLLDLTNKLHANEDAATIEPFFEELNVALQVRDVLQHSLRKSAGLPTEKEPSSAA